MVSYLWNGFCERQSVLCSSQMLKRESIHHLQDLKHGSAASLVCLRGPSGFSLPGESAWIISMKCRDYQTPFPLHLHPVCSPVPGTDAVCVPGVGISLWLRWFLWKARGVVGWFLPRAALADASPCVCDSAAQTPAAHCPGPEPSPEQLPVAQEGTALPPPWPAEQSWSLVWLVAEALNKNRWWKEQNRSMPVSETLVGRVWAVMAGLPQFRVLWRAWSGAQPQVWDSPVGQSPLRREGVLQVFMLQPSSCKLGRSCRSLWVLGWAWLCVPFAFPSFVPPSPPVSLCVSAYLRCKKQQQFHGFSLEEAQMLDHLWPCENTPVLLQKSVGDVLVGGDFSCCLFLLLVCRRSVQHQLPLLSLFLGWWKQQSFVDSEKQSSI